MAQPKIGRPKEYGKREALFLRLDPKLVKRVKALAKKADKTATEWVEAILMQAAPEA